MDNDYLSRVIRFDGLMNCRDLGGIVNAEGQRVKRGLLLRSECLDALSDADLRRFSEKWKLKLVIDLRTRSELAERPDRRVEGAEYVHAPVFEDAELGITHEQVNENVAAERDPFPPMAGLYRFIVSRASCQAGLGAALKRVMERTVRAVANGEPGCALWHCSEGKDRCGLMSALLLGALEVDRDTIMHDYLLTNVVNIPRAEAHYREMISEGASLRVAQSVRQAYLADSSYLNAAFEVIYADGASPEPYLRDALGIDGALLRDFRSAVME